MTPLFKKLNLKAQTEILVLNAPESLEPELSALSGISVLRHADSVEAITFLLAFVTQQAEVDAIAAIVAQKAKGDAVVWFAYPKKKSKQNTCEINRDHGWDTLGEFGFEGVRQVAIDDYWSALRFRRAEFIKTMTRDQKRAMSEAGKAKLQ